MAKKDKPRAGVIVVAIIVSIVLLLSVLHLAGVINLNIFAEDYGTGLNLDTTANYYNQDKDYEPFKGELWLKGSGEEVLVEDKYIVSWQPGQYSQTITARADFQYHARARCEGWFCGCGYTMGILLGTYKMKVYHIDIDNSQKKIIDTSLNNWFDTDYVYWIRGASSSRYISTGDHLLPGHLLPNLKYVRPAVLNPVLYSEFGNEYWHYPQTENDGQAQWYSFITDTIEFKIKGNLVGGLKVDIILNYAQREGESGIIPCQGHYVIGDALVATDNAYLASGEGEINVESTEAIRSEGTEQTPETGIIYTKYVFEEGTEVQMKVDAGYSGNSLPSGETGSGLGWRVEIYDSKGISRYFIDIPDNVRGYPVPFTIPSGAFIPSDPNDNEWRAVLKNTLFDQSETRLFVVDSFEKIPGPTTIITDKQRYTQFETVYVTLTAESNENTGLPIAKFTAWAKYGSPSSIDYASLVKDYLAIHSGGRTYTASFSFQLTKGDKNVYIRAHAIDSESRAGFEGEWNVFSEQAVGNYQVTVTVLDTAGSPVPNAEVALGESSSNTNPQGVAKIYIDYGTYLLTVTKSGYSTYTQSGIRIQSDTDIDVELKPTGAGDLTLFIVIAIVIIFLVVAVVYYRYGGKRKSVQGKGKKKLSLFGKIFGKK